MMFCLMSANADTGPISLILDGDWKFRRDPQNVGLKENWQRTDLDDSSWDIMKVPGDWGKDADGVGWYRKRITVPERARTAANVALLFGSADDRAELFLNGRLARRSRSWSTPFLVDPRPFMGADGSLLIAVRVEDIGGPGGIVESVSLRSADALEDLYKTPLYDQRIPHTLDDTGGIVLYSVYTRNFSQEGTFNALRARLPELKALGVNTLWLLPIHEIGIEKRKGPDGSPYAIKDYYSISHDLGTKEDFKALVKATHDQGMKILIDSVMNHTSPDSTWAAEHPEWFSRDEQGKPKPDVAEWSDVVDLDWNNKVVWEEATKVMEYWVREFDIDGYRCDVADMMPAAFWLQARARLDAIKPGIVMLAESGNPSHFFNGFDIIYSDGVRDVMHEIVNGNATADDMRQEIYNQLYSQPRRSTRMLFVENHDKPRVMNFLKSRAQVEALAVLTATLPGVPLVYTGTEVGANADRDATFFVKSLVDWSDPQQMRPFWGDLLARRAKYRALQTGEFRFVEAEPADRVLVYERFIGDDVVTISVNLSNEPATLKLKTPNPEVPNTMLPWEWKINASH